jgi:hypothetical protein
MILQNEIGIYLVVAKDLLLFLQCPPPSCLFGFDAMKVGSHKGELSKLVSEVYFFSPNKKGS